VGKTKELGGRKKAGRRKTPGEMLKKVQSVAQKRGGKCLSKRYLERPKKMWFECAEGHRWAAGGWLVLGNGNWCPKCALTPSDEFRHALDTFIADQGGVMLTRRLGKLSDPHRFRCEKGHRFEQSPTRIVHKGFWCPSCAYEKKGELQRLGIDAVREKARQNGGECLSDNYANANDKGWFRCKEGHEWETSYKGVLYGDTWCPECWAALKKAGLNKEGKFVPRSLPRKIELEYCQEFAEERGGRCISVEYDGARGPLEWQCDKGHEWEASLHTMEQRVSFCLECVELERRAEWLRKAHAIAHEFGGECLSDEWVSAQSRLRWRCANGHEFEQCWNQILLPPFCSTCDREERYQKQGEDLLTGIAASHNGHWVRERYKGVRARYRFVCSEGIEFTATPAVATNTWHKNCACGVRKAS